MRFSFYCAGALLFAAASSAGIAADLKFGGLDCSKSMCYGKKLAGPYTWKASDTCQNIAQSGKLNFYNAQQVETINKPLSNFTCANAKAGHLICYPSVKGGAKC